MNQEELKSIFRAGELERREARRKVILNHAALSDEAPCPEEAAAILRIQKQSEEYSELVKIPYFKRLWKAILGKGVFE